MMTDTPLYNTRIINSYVEYLKRYLPDIDIAPLLKYAEIETYQLNDEGHWLTQRQSDRFHEILVQMTQDPNIAGKVGRYSTTSRASGALGQYLLGFINPSTAYDFLGKINSRISRATVLKIKHIGANQIEVKATVKPGVNEKHYQCVYRTGSLESLAKLFTNKFATVEHPVCLHKGGDCCLYIVTWEKTRTFFWKQIRNYYFVLGFILCAILLMILKSDNWDELIFSYITIALSVTLYAEYREKKESIANVQNQGDTADRLLDQISKRYNEALLIQEIGQASAMILEIDKLLRFIMESLRKRLDFDRGMIMLANKQKDCLVYTDSYGYNPKHEDYLKNIKFHLNNPNSKGVAVIAFKKQKPILINEVSEIEDSLSSKSLDFVRDMGTQSFICVPIVYKGESMGIMIVDNLQSKRPLSQTDMSLLMGIAPQIGVSINNAVAYQKIKESEVRFRSLSENAPDIIYTLGIKGEFTYINPAIETILGYKSEEILGKYFGDIARKEDALRYDKAFQEVRNGKQTIKEDIVILIHKDGSERYFSISGAPSFDSKNSFIGLVGILKDLTDIRKSEMELKRSFEKLESVMSSTIDAISIIVESRDPYTAGHQRRVTQLATAIAGDMGLSAEKIDLIRMGSLIHDIGKIYIPAEILTKPTRLNDIELSLIKSHPLVGYNILKQVDFIPAIVDMVYQHHEKLDGSGYPLGISGDDILLESRIITVADMVEAMASHRPYRAAMGTKAALEKIKQQRGITLDAGAVDTCLKLFEEKGFKFKDHEDVTARIDDIQ